MHVALGFLCIKLLWATATYAQRSLTSFGPYIDFSTEYSPLGLAAGHFNLGGRAQVVAISAEAPHLNFYRLDNSTIELAYSRTSEHSPAFVTTAGLFVDGKAECLTISSDGSFISITSEQDSVIAEKSIALEIPSQRCIVADVNNDKRKDILLFGKKREGITVLLGKPGSVFSKGPLLFPEVSISDVKAADLNGDGITDIVFLNWLTNQMSMAYGIGRGVFSEQATLDLTSEPSALAVTPLSKQRTIQVAVTLPEQNRIAVFKGDATGDFAQAGTINCGANPSGVAFGNVNDDAFIDVITSTSNGIEVSLGTSPASFSDPTVFGVGRSIVAWAIADLDGGGRNDIVAADRIARKVIVLGNSSQSGSYAWPTRYAVGGEPKGLVIGDFDNDGYDDVAVANTASASISVLFGRGKGMLRGQQSISVAEKPEYFTEAVVAEGSDHLLVTSHSSTDRLSVVRVTKPTDQPKLYFIPTAAHPYVLYAAEDSSTQLLKILVRHSPGSAGSATLSLFEQIPGGQFLEKSVRPSLPSRILALTVNSLRGAGPYDLVFATHDKTIRNTTLSVSFGGESFDFKEAKPIIAFRDSLVSTQSLFSGNINGDAFKDIVVYLGDPRNALGIAYGRGDGTVKDSMVWIQGVRLADDDAVAFVDADGDNERDIAYLDATSVMVAYGRRDGTFQQPRAVHRAPGITSFRIERMRNTSGRDLILSHGPSGTISVIFDPFKR